MPRSRLGLLSAPLLIGLTIACGTPAVSTPTPTTPVAVEATAPEAAAGPTTAPATSSGPVGLNERAESGGQALTVLGVERTAKMGDFLTAKEGNTYIVAEVLIEATADKAPYNFFYFKVKDADGVEYTPAVNTDPKSIKSGELPAGDKVRGTVAFEVPTASKGLVMSYQPIVISNADAIRVALPDA